MVGIFRTISGNTLNAHSHTSIIIGFPSFIAFFKSPAKPSKKNLNLVKEKKNTYRGKEEKSITFSQKMDLSQR